MAKRILLIEEETYLAEYYDNLLRNEGYSVEISYNGEHAYKKLSNQSFDLILLDIYISLIDGTELIRKIKYDKEIKAQGPIIILTNLEPENLSELRELYKEHDNNPEHLGIKDYIVKPSISNEEFIRKVKKSFLF